MKPEISFDDFLKIDIRVGTIVSAEPVPKSKKLLKLEVFFGEEVGKRTILAGIAKDYVGLDQLAGVSVAAVVNLAPREMMGYTSHGMLLASSFEDKVFLLNPAGYPGTTVG